MSPAIVHEMLFRCEKKADYRIQLMIASIPMSMTKKNTATKMTVVKTVTVYFVSSLRLGQLTFRISEATFRKKLLILLMMTYPPTSVISNSLRQGAGHHTVCLWTV